MHGVLRLLLDLILVLEGLLDQIVPTLQAQNVSERFSSFSMIVAET